MPWTAAQPYNRQFFWLWSSKFRFETHQGFCSVLPAFLPGNVSKQHGVAMVWDNRPAINFQFFYRITTFVQLWFISVRSAPNALYQISSNIHQKSLNMIRNLQRHRSFLLNTRATLLTTIFIFYEVDINGLRNFEDLYWPIVFFVFKSFCWLLQWEWLAPWICKQLVLMFTRCQTTTLP